MEKTYRLKKDVAVFMHVGDKAEDCYITFHGGNKMQTFSFSDDCYAIDLDSLELVFEAYGVEVGTKGE